MPSPDLKYVPGRLSGGYSAVPVSGDQASTPVRLCLVARTEQDPTAGSLVQLRDLVDSRVYLGCLCDADGQVHQWVEVWVQDTAGLARTPRAVRDSLTNAMLDDRWSRVVKALENSERPLLIKTGWEGPGRPSCTFLDIGKKSVVHPADKQSGDRWRLCTDDSALAKVGLPVYSGSLHRYLWLPELGADGPFVALSPDSPANAKCKPLTEVTGGKAELVPFNPGCGFVMARLYSPIAFETYADLLGGSPWKGIPHGRSVLDLELSTRPDVQGVPDHLTEGGLFLGQQGRMGRLVESFHLKLRALADAVGAVRAMASESQRPLLNVSADSFQVRIGEPVRGLPYLWTARVTLADPGDALALGVQTSDARYYVPGRGAAVSVYRPESAGRVSQGSGSVRIREILTERGDETVLEGTLATDERVEATKNDLVWIRLNLKAGRVDLYAKLDTKAAMAAGEWRFRTVAQRLAADVTAQLGAAKGVPLPDSPFEVIPLISTPADLYALAVLAVRTLLVDPRTSLPVAVDEVLSLARQLAAEYDAALPIEERIRRLFDKDPRWLASLGPQRLSFEAIDPGEVFSLVPAPLWWSTLAAIVRMFPGIGPDSRCADLGAAPASAVQRVFDPVLSDLDRLLRRTRSLIVIDWKYNREIHAVVRGFLTKMGVGKTPARAR